MSGDTVAAIKKFLRRFDEMVIEDNTTHMNGFEQEFRKLRLQGNKDKEENTYPAEEGKKKCNVRKNRYKDIVPYDETRVLLSPIPDIPASDYINANYIKSVSGERAYIASQGPLTSTVDDFWRMLWEHNIEVMVMACREEEGNKPKCDRYWPKDKEEERCFGDIKVQLVSEEKQPSGFIIRIIDAFKDQESHRITHFHLAEWPDHGVPEAKDQQSILEVIYSMQKAKVHHEIPVLVHCSAGCGRTGTICAIDYSWNMLKTGKLNMNFSLYEIMKEMRKQRQSMVQTPDQYTLVHYVVQQIFRDYLKNVHGVVYENFTMATENKDEDYINSDNVSSAVEKNQTYEDIKNIMHSESSTLLKKTDILSHHPAPLPTETALADQQPLILPIAKKSSNGCFVQKPDGNVSKLYKSSTGPKHLPDNAPTKESKPTVPKSPALSYVNVKQDISNKGECSFVTLISLDSEKNKAYSADENNRHIYHNNNAYSNVVSEKNQRSLANDAYEDMIPKRMLSPKTSQQLHSSSSTVKNKDLYAEISDAITLTSSSDKINASEHPNHLYHAISNKKFNKYFQDASKSKPDSVEHSSNLYDSVQNERQQSSQDASKNKNIQKMPPSKVPLQLHMKDRPKKDQPLQRNVPCGRQVEVPTTIIHHSLLNDAATYSVPHLDGVQNGKSNLPMQKHSEFERMNYTVMKKEPVKGRCSSSDGGDYVELDESCIGTQTKIQVCGDFAPQLPNRNYDSDEVMDRLPIKDVAASSSFGNAMKSKMRNLLNFKTSANTSDERSQGSHLIGVRKVASLGFPERINRPNGPRDMPEIWKKKSY